MERNRLTSRYVVYYVVYYEALEKSRPMMLLKAMFGIMAMQPSGSVLMSMANVLSKAMWMSPILTAA